VEENNRRSKERKMLYCIMQVSSSMAILLRSQVNTRNTISYFKIICKNNVDESTCVKYISKKYRNSLASICDCKKTTHTKKINN
jgi:hypothetical protein